MNGYPGAKNGPGVYQTIINNMPPHDLYIEAFVGSGAILLRKKPAGSSIVIDADADVAQHWSTIAAAGEYPNLRSICGDARSLIAGFAEEGDRRTLIYCDPPYMRLSRRSQKALYKKEFWLRIEHSHLLRLLLSLKCRVMISGYRTELYDEALAEWRRVDISAMTRGGPAVECLWCNFAPSEQLHDLRYLGDNFRERERIKRKKARWVARLAKMDPLERSALLEALRDPSPPKPAMTPARPSPPAATMRARAGGGG